jgi:hypothetical protein
MAVPRRVGGGSSCLFSFGFRFPFCVCSDAQCCCKAPGRSGGVVPLGMLAFLVFVSIRLVQFREEALGIAGALLLLELVGGVLIMAGENYLGFREFTSLTAAVMAGSSFWSGLCRTR